MIIKKLVKNKNKSNFILNKINKLKIIDIVKLINKNKLGFIILNSIKLRIITDGDIRRYIANGRNLNKSVLKEDIGSTNVISIDVNKNLYEASKLIISKKINTLVITKNNKIYSYLEKDEILKFLSPERITIEKSKIKKYQLDIAKHFLRYNFASLFSNKKFIVLDAACGTGYGSYVLSKYSKKIISVDNSETAIKYAKMNYQKNNINFIKKDINKLNYKNKFDMIISIETIEHLNKKDSINWLKKCKIMLKKSGILICSSPMLRLKNNKPYITNPHHLHEMKRAEFLNNLKKIFNPKIFLSFIQDDSTIKPLTNEKDGLCFTYLKL